MQYVENFATAGMFAVLGFIASAFKTKMSEFDKSVREEPLFSALEADDLTLSRMFATFAVWFEPYADSRLSSSSLSSSSLPKTTPSNSSVGECMAALRHGSERLFVLNANLEAFVLKHPNYNWPKTATVYFEQIQASARILEEFCMAVKTPNADEQQRQTDAAAALTAFVAAAANATDKIAYLVYGSAFS